VARCTSEDPDHTLQQITSRHSPLKQRFYVSVYRLLSLSCIRINLVYLCSVMSMAMTDLNNLSQTLSSHFVATSEDHYFITKSFTWDASWRDVFYDLGVFLGSVLAGMIAYLLIVRFLCSQHEPLHLLPYAQSVDFKAVMDTAVAMRQLDSSAHSRLVVGLHYTTVASTSWMNALQ
jgi:hypothetical protein